MKQSVLTELFDVQCAWKDSITQTCNNCPKVITLVKRDQDHPPPRLEKGVILEWEDCASKFAAFWLSLSITQLFDIDLLTYKMCFSSAIL